MKLLESKKYPEALKSFSFKEMEQLAAEIRELIIDAVSQNGGHLSSNLGIVEVTLALHKTFNMPDDKIVWDVGHQCYPHKIVTGRLPRFHSLRQFGGISGFPKSSESCFDCFDAGHSGTSISAALGMAVQRDLSGQSHKVIAVIGDASLTNGMALEAMNNAGFMGTDIIIVLNDNEKSISRNVGAYSKHLNKLRVEVAHRQTRHREKTSFTLSGQKPFSESLFSQLRERVKHALTPSRTGAVFQELGFMYLGPIDGHDVKSLCEVFESVKRLSGPILIHVVTQKGKGYVFAEKDSTKFHGIEPFDCANGNVHKNSHNPSFTAVFGSTLVDLAREDKRIVAITAAMEVGTGLTEFKKAFPRRFFDVGIAEEHAVTFAAGLSKAGAIPVVAIYSTFLQRAYDQILHDVCLQRLPVKFMIDRGGIVGEDGPTHQGVFDLSYLRSMPEMCIMCPKDENELRHMIKTAITYSDGPIAVRYPRGEGLGIALDPALHDLPIGRAEILREGNDSIVLAVGPLVYVALEAAEILREKGWEIAVVNARFVKPLDRNLLETAARRYDHLITVEENTLAGGFGSGVLEYLSDCQSNVRVHRIGLPDSFIEHGAQRALREKYGLTGRAIASSIERILRQS